MTFCEESGRGGLGPSAAVPLALRVNATCSIPSCPMKTISECSAFSSAVKTRQADTIASCLRVGARNRSEEHTSVLQSLIRITYAVCYLKHMNTGHTTDVKITRLHSNHKKDHIYHD